LLCRFMPVFVTDFVGKLWFDLCAGGGHSFVEAPSQSADNQEKDHTKDDVGDGSQLMLGMRRVLWELSFCQMHEVYSDESSEGGGCEQTGPASKPGGSCGGGIDYCDEAVADYDSGDGRDKGDAE